MAQNFVRALMTPRGKKIPRKKIVKNTAYRLGKWYAAHNGHKTGLTNKNANLYRVINACENLRVIFSSQVDYKSNAKAARI